MITIASLRREPSWVRESLAWPFDFDVASMNETRELGWFRFPAGVDFSIVATDGAGGVYGVVRYPGSEDNSLGYISSEGQCGVIAESLSSGVALILTAPYWSDLAKFSGGGQIDQMRRAIPYLESELRQDTPETLELRPRLLAHFDLSKLDDPAFLLHRSICTYRETFQVCSPDGEAFETLFNRFTVDENPQWAR